MLFSFRLVLLALFCLFAFAGCVSKNSTPPDIAQKYKWEGEETIEPYVPRDDGVPLSPTELAAFQSAGPVDKKVSQEDRANVELHFKYFVHEHRATMQRFIDRTARFLPYMKKTFRDRGLPEDLAYLSIVESGGNPNAISRAGAVGLWQFMPYTGKQFALTQNSWVDERRDPFKATYAATDYLLKLYNDFSDWHLAVAAYNAGEGKIGRALAGTGANDFFELCRLGSQLEPKAQLREETRQYVPKLLAVIKIMRNVKSLGFTPPDPHAAYDLVPLSIPAGTNLSAMARDLGLTWDEFSSMNPAFRRTASPPNATTTAYVIPSQKAQAETWLASAEARAFAGWREHTVQKRDSLASIAKKYKISTSAIQQANGFSALPKPGNTIVIPRKSDNVEPIFAAPLDKVTPTGPGAGKYTVQAGDTLFSLARQWGTDVDSIRQINKMGSGTISPGQRLIVPGGSKNPPTQFSGGGRADAPAPSGGSYVVKKGDTIYSIAKACNTSVEGLCEVNGIDSKVKLQAGRTLRVPGAKQSGQKAQAAQKGQAAARSNPPSAQPAASPTKPDTATQPAASPKPAKAGSITIQKGDTLFSIAQKNKTSVDALLRTNNMKPGDNIKLGQVLRLP